MNLRRSLFPLRRIIRPTMKSKVKCGVDSTKDGTGVSVMLNSVMDEYTKEKQRSLSLDGKAAFFMTTIIGVLTFLFLKLPFKQIIDNITADNFIFYGCLFSIIVGTVLLIWAFWNMLRSYQLVSYMGLDIDDLGSEENMEFCKGDVQKALCKKYSDILRKNAAENDKKAVKIKRGIQSVFWGFIFLFFATMGFLFATKY